MSRCWYQVSRKLRWWPAAQWVKVGAHYGCGVALSSVSRFTPVSSWENPRCPWRWSSLRKMVILMEKYFDGELSRVNGDLSGFCVFTYAQSGAKIDASEFLDRNSSSFPFFDRLRALLSMTQFLILTRLTSLFPGLHPARRTKCAGKRVVLLPS